MDSRSGNMELLRRSTFFSAAGDAAMAELVRLSFTQLLPRGTVVFEQEEQPDFLHVLLAGSIGLQTAAETGGKTIVEIFGPGEVFLAPAVLLRLPYLASAVALTEIRVLMIPAESFRTGVRDDLALAGATIELLARHWRLMVDQVVDLKLRSAEARVARFIARRVSEETGAGTAALPEPRIAIAARLGMTPETLSRTLTTLEEKGALRRGGSEGPTVRDRTALAPGRATGSSTGESH
ncbi:cyclic nucleotide-binding domain-containing protein [Neoroseomonas soli]|uniref:Cyclic nucleotide-binding domain-containing protein n=1 Tax=Neoroseomonas soli TaxID=1081025 RepID=A0A9X9X020_9PROT|nr:cyclic nucleotide-binding domain-containing protein [Neoroseomonas soli]MBR0672749.1 cyclic nucleotide-binding domain-containing protein [Neoroseomonas soli]